jgi:hypothetical protein
MVEIFNQLIKSCCTRIVPPAKTRSIGLQADAQLSWFLQHLLDNFIVTGQLPFVYQDSAVKIVASGQENLRPPTGTLQKRMPTLTLTATNQTVGLSYGIGDRQ